MTIELFVTPGTKSNFASLNPRKGLGRGGQRTPTFRQLRYEPNVIGGESIVVIRTIPDSGLLLSTF